MNALFYACVCTYILFSRPIHFSLVGVMFLLRVTYGRHMSVVKRATAETILNEALNI